MLAWVSLVHAGTWFPAELSRHLVETLGITLAEQDLLNQLAKSGGEISMTDLAERLFLSKAGLTRMVDRMVAEELVARVPSQHDRRSLSARLTRRGSSLLKRSRSILTDWVQVNFASRLSQSETRELLGSLQKLLDSHGRWEGQLEHLGRK